MLHYVIGRDDINTVHCPLDPFTVNPSLAEHEMPCLKIANSVDPDQLASEEANWLGSTLFVIKYVNFYQKPRSSNLIGWKLEGAWHLNLFSMRRANPLKTGDP